MVEEDPKTTVESNVLPHPDAVRDFVEAPPEITLIPELPEDMPPPPPSPKLPAMCRQMPQLPPLEFPPGVGDPMIRDLAISLFSAFVLGVSVATIISVYSRRSVADA